jgi:hypothetical protein
MDRPPKPFLVRIAVSLACLTACEVLLVLWVRSYSGIDGTTSLRVASSQGKLYVNQSLTLVAPKSYGGPILVTPLFGDFYTFTPSGVRVQFVRPGFGVPYWSIVLAMIVVGVAPWFRWRFSLLSLFIVMTLIAAVIGIFMARDWVNTEPQNTIPELPPQQFPTGVPKFTPASDVSEGRWRPRSGQSTSVVGALPLTIVMPTQLRLRTPCRWTCGRMTW